MSNYQRTASWLKACGKVPVPLHLSTQIGCHLEEVVEFLQHLTFQTPDGQRFDFSMNAVMRQAIEDLEWVADHTKNGNVLAVITSEDRVGALDALCDCEVTGNGVAYLAEFDKDAADQAVLASNDAKLVDGKPVFKPGTTKIGKPEGWTPPSLNAFV